MGRGEHSKRREEHAGSGAHLLRDRLDQYPIRPSRGGTCVQSLCLLVLACLFSEAASARPPAVHSHDRTQWCLRADPGHSVQAGWAGALSRGRDHDDCSRPRSHLQRRPRRWAREWWDGDTSPSFPIASRRAATPVACVYRPIAQPDRGGPSRGSATRYAALAICGHCPISMAAGGLMGGSTAGRRRSPRWSHRKATQSRSRRTDARASSPLWRCIPGARRVGSWRPGSAGVYSPVAPLLISLERKTTGRRQNPQKLTEAARRLGIPWRSRSIRGRTTHSTAISSALRRDARQRECPRGPRRHHGCDPQAGPIVFRESSPSSASTSCDGKLGA